MSIRRPTATTADRAAPSATRAALIAAARAAFTSVGYAGTDTNRIARAAGFAPQTFYRHFPDKAAIFAEVHARWVDDLLAAMTAAPSVPAAARALIAAHRRQRVFRRALRELALTDRRVRATRARHRQAQLAALTDRGSPLTGAGRAAWLLGVERWVDALVDGELADLGIDRATAVATLEQLLARGLGRRSA
jgi:AcrR family transcriptional regulator